MNIIHMLSIHFIIRIRTSNGKCIHTFGQRVFQRDAVDIFLKIHLRSYTAINFCCQRPLAFDWTYVPNILKLRLVILIEFLRSTCFSNLQNSLSFLFNGLILRSTTKLFKTTLLLCIPLLESNHCIWCWTRIRLLELLFPALSVNFHSISKLYHIANFLNRHPNSCSVRIAERK